jgi:hypothetical protein
MGATIVILLIAISLPVIDVHFSLDTEFVEYQEFLDGGKQS